MKSVLLLALTLFFVASPLVSEAQKRKKRKDRKIFGFHLTQNRRSMRIPFELHANLIIIPTRVNDSDTLHFILDTGVSNTIVTDPSINRYLNTDYGRTIRLDGVGADTTMEALVSIGNRVEVGYARIDEHNLIVLKEDLLKLSELLGTPIHGLIGYDLFERFVVTLDFQRRMLLIEQPKYFKYRPRRHGEIIPLEIIDKKPYLSDVVINETGEEEKVRLLVDTGAGHAIMLNSYATSIPIPDTTIAVQLGMGLSGKISGVLGRLDGVRIGSYGLSGVVTSFPDSASFGGKINPLVERQGNVGGELLRRFQITINYPERYMTMKPVRRAMKEPFEHDMSGLDLRARGAKFDEYFIDKVMKDSPAAQAGLKEGDRLMFIDNAAVSMLNMTDIYKLLQRKEGKEIDLIVNRQGTIIFTTLVLKRII